MRDMLAFSTAPEHFGHGRFAIGSRLNAPKKVLLGRHRSLEVHEICVTCASNFSHLAMSGLVHMRDMPAFFMASECLDYCCFAIGFGPV